MQPTLPLPPNLVIDDRFSKQLPGLQLQINSSSLGPFKLCPRRYYYEILCGYRTTSESINLTFGTLVHAGRHQYELAKANGLSHRDALESTVLWALKETWDTELHKPKNNLGTKKSRTGLIRALVWYFTQYGERDELDTIQLPHGPAIEVSFGLELGINSQTTREAFMAYGTLDRIARMNDSNYLLDTKTTEFTVSPQYFDRYSPDNQFSFYVFVGEIIVEQPIKGLIVDAIQIGTDFVRTQRGVIQRDHAQMGEWLHDFGIALQHLEQYALRQYWPQNDKACGLFGGCPFRRVCAASPASRDHVLRTNYISSRKSEDI